VIQGSKNLAGLWNDRRHGFGRQYGVNSTGEGDRVGPVVARRAENVAIVGQGGIEGSGNAFFDFTKPHIGMDFDPRYTPGKRIHEVHVGLLSRQQWQDAISRKVRRNCQVSGL
jgi:hypothetical protein